MLIPKIVGKLKMLTSKHINIQRETLGIKTWKPSYHDHVVRNYGAYLRIRQSIINNPKKWTEKYGHTKH